MNVAFAIDLTNAVAMNPGWVYRADAIGDTIVCRLQNHATREEVNGCGATPDEAMEVLLVRMELSGRFLMPGWQS